MLYARAQGPFSSFVYAHVGDRGFGPFYQRRAWDHMSKYPAAFSVDEWMFFVYSLDSYIDTGFGLRKD